MSMSTFVYFHQLCVAISQYLFIYLVMEHYYLSRNNIIVIIGQLSNISNQGSIEERNVLKCSKCHGKFLNMIFSFARKVDVNRNPGPRHQSSFLFSLKFSYTSQNETRSVEKEKKIYCFCLFIIIGN